MPEASGQPSKRFGGSRTYVTARHIEIGTGLAFEHAYALTKLVLEEFGGPVPCRGRKATISTPTRKALMELGLIRVDASSEFTEWAYAELNVDGRLADVLEAKFIHTTVTDRDFTEGSKWAAVATQAGFDLVAKHLP
jgi:hypothetical protein